MTIHGTHVVNCRPLRGVASGTSIPLQDMIDQSKVIDINLIPQFQEVVNDMSLPVRVRSAINSILEARLPQYLPNDGINVVYTV